MRKEEAEELAVICDCGHCGREILEGDIYCSINVQVEHCEWTPPDRLPAELVERPDAGHALEHGCFIHEVHMADLVEAYCMDCITALYDRGTFLKLHTDNLSGLLTE